MWLVLASLGMLFAASILGYLIMRWQFAAAMDAAASASEPSAPAVELPALPRLLWLSTALLILSSVTMQWAVVSVRRNAQSALRAALILTLVLGMCFLIAQGFCWKQMIGAHTRVFEQLADLPRYVIASFYVLTALHAAHVIGGLVPMVIVAFRSLTGRYGPGHDAAVHYVSMYWHFLGGVWFALFMTLLLAW